MKKHQTKDMRTFNGGDMMEHLIDFLESVSGMATLQPLERFEERYSDGQEWILHDGMVLTLLWDEPLVSEEQLLATAMELVEEDDCMGLCHHCGEVQWGCEPDARAYKCDACEKHTVFGAEESMMMLGGSL